MEKNLHKANPNHHILPLQDSQTQIFLSPVCSQSKPQGLKTWRTPAFVLWCLWGHMAGCSHVLWGFEQTGARDVLEKQLWPAQRSVPGSSQSCRLGLEVLSALQAGAKGISGTECHPGTARAGGSFTLPSLTPWSCWHPRGQNKEMENLIFHSSSWWKRESPLIPRMKVPLHRGWNFHIALIWCWKAAEIHQCCAL